MSKEKLLERYPKAIVHLRAQRRRLRLGLIFGSGASADLGFPKWTELVESIARDPAVDAEDLLQRFNKPAKGVPPITRSLSALTQIIFGKFRDREVTRQKLIAPLTFVEEQKIRTDWLKIIHSQLYRGIVVDTRSDMIRGHVYLKSFLDIIKHSALTVNYNFDDTLEKLLLDSRTEKEQNTTRGYEVIDKPNAQFQKENSVIYHPNGFLPSVFTDGSSSEVVFSDDAFQDQLISAATGKYVHLSNHLFRNTCLLIGLSLDDVTLQSLLRQNAVSNPGNVHYIIHYLPSDSKSDSETEAIIFNSNFYSYNLYTLFLTNEDIRDVAELISMDQETFSLTYPNLDKKFIYYLIGSIGAGKSTAATSFRSLITYDEWIDERRPGLAVHESELSDEEKEELNRWVVEQFRKKNFALTNNSEGIHLVDRSPLDPLTFGKPGERPTKASTLIQRITDNKARKIAPGHLIILDCDILDVQIRSSLKHKYWKEEEYRDLLKEIGEVYGRLTVSKVCTRGRNARAVAHEIAKVIFLDDYRPVDIEAELTKFSETANAAQ